VNDPLFQEAWPKAVRTRFEADRERYQRRAQENRSGLHGEFSRAYQFEVDGVFEEYKRALRGMVGRVELN
jgi:hypothetical protein